jgi:8-oxo-dGTP pyrophosphatase MutT (NUDIX family)
MTVAVVPPERRAFSVAIFARHRGAILLVHHRRLGVWLPVGGEIERGETPLEAAARELQEETGLEGSFPTLPGSITGSPPGLLAYEEHVAGAKGLHMNFCFVADVSSREVVSNGEFVDHRWISACDPVDAPTNVIELLARIRALQARG